jgi:hypothetical protein
LDHDGATHVALVFRRCAVQDNRNLSQCGDREGNMDELNRLGALRGLDRVIAEQSIDVIYGLPPRVSESGGATNGATREAGQFT